MKRVLVLGDVHANAPALDAILSVESAHDAVLFLGDAVDCGPHPDDACERLRGLDLLAGVRGNHDRSVLAAGDAPAETDTPSDDPYARWKRWSYDRLTDADREFLESLDTTATVAPEGRTLRLHHGDFSPPESYDGEWRTRVTPEDDPAYFEALADRYDEDAVLLGHSHYPFVATVAGTTFVNPGSVGLQRPGWPVDRARYAVLGDGEFDLRSVEYDPGTVAADSHALDNPFSADWDRVDASPDPDASVPEAESASEDV